MQLDLPVLLAGDNDRVGERDHMLDGELRKRSPHVLGGLTVGIGDGNQIAQEGRRARRWTMLVAVVELVGGIVIVSTPGVGVATLALLVGLSLIARGIAMCGVAWLMRRLGVGGELGDAPPSPVTVS